MAPYMICNVVSDLRVVLLLSLAKPLILAAFLEAAMPIGR